MSRATRNVAAAVSDEDVGEEDPDEMVEVSAASMLALAVD